MEKYLTSEQVAAVLQVHPFTVLKYLKSGTLEGVKIGRVYRIKESDVEKFLDGSAVKSEAKTEIRVAKPISSPARRGESVAQEPESKEEDVHELKFQDDEEKNPTEYYQVL